MAAIIEDVIDYDLTTVQLFSLCDCFVSFHDLSDIFTVRTYVRSDVKSNKSLKCFQNLLISTL